MTRFEVYFPGILLALAVGAFLHILWSYLGVFPL
jgi:hypothetical protein